MLLPLMLACLSGGAAAEEPAASAPSAEAAAVPITPPTVKTFIEADYPPAARVQGLEGRVVLRLAIDDTGAVADAVVLEPAGDGFDEAALAAARQLTFTPATTPDGPVAVQIDFAYGFELGEADTPAPITLEGVLLDRTSRAPLVDQPITVTAGELVFEAASDSAGRFALRGVPPGKATIVVGVGDTVLAREAVEVVAGEVTQATVRVDTGDPEDNEMVVLGAREAVDVTRRTITVEEIKRVPGTFGDPVRVIQNLPGAARAPFGTGLLVIRGANPEDSNVYIDGVAVPIIYHLGGYRSVINADLIESVDYLPGGYSVRYGQSTGGVIDVRTRTSLPEQPQITVKSDILDTGVYYRQPVGESGAVAAAARRSYIDAFLPIFNNNSGGFFILPRWFDYQTRIWRNTGTDQLSLFVFGYGDRLSIATPDDFAQGTDPDTQGDLSARYGAHRIVANWTHRFDDDLKLIVQPFAGIDDVAFGLGTTLAVEQDFSTVGLRASLPWQPHPAVLLTPGLDSQLTKFAVNVTLPFQLDASGDPLAEREGSTTTLDGWGIIPDPYLDLKLFPLADRDRLMVNPGLRLGGLILPDDARALLAWDPRLIVRGEVVPGGVIKGGTGLYSQPPEGQEFGLDDQQVLRFERSWASEIGWEQTVVDGFTLDLTFFSKDLDRLVVQNPDLGDEDDAPLFVNLGEGRVRGLEFMARRAPVGDFFGWVSYTLSRSERNDRPGRADSEWYPFDFDQTHILTVVAGYDLPREWGASARFQHVSGNPYTPYTGAIYDVDDDSYIGFQGGDWNSQRLAPYTALDLRVDKTWTFKGWKLQAYTDLLNVIRGENPEQLQYNYDYTESSVVRGLPFIPSVGLQADIYFRPRGAHAPSP